MDELLIKAIKTKVEIAFSHNKLADIISNVDNEEIVGIIRVKFHEDVIISFHWRNSYLKLLN